MNLVVIIIIVLLLFGAVGYGGRRTDLRQSGLCRRLRHHRADPDRGADHGPAWTALDF